MRNIIIVLAFAATFIACGSSREGSKATLSKEVLTAEEIATTSAITAYDAVRLRRPAFLTSRGPKSIVRGARSTVNPLVYMNDMLYGELETLKNISVLDVKEIRYIDPKDATLIYGTGHVAGIIMVITKR